MLDPALLYHCQSCLFQLENMLAALCSQLIGYSCQYIREEDCLMFNTMPSLMKTTRAAPRFSTSLTYTCDFYKVLRKDCYFGLLHFETMTPPCDIPEQRLQNQDGKLTNSSNQSKIILLLILLLTRRGRNCTSSHSLLFKFQFTHTA